MEETAVAEIETPAPAGSLDLSYEAPADEAEAAPDAVVVETPKEAPPAAPLELAEFRDDKGGFDVVKLKAALADAKSAAAFQKIVGVIDADQEAAVATLKAMKKAGYKLTEQQEGLIAPKAAPAPEKTEAQINGEYYAILNKDGEAAAQRYWHQNVTIPAQRALIEEQAQTAKAKADAENATSRAAEQKTAATKQITSEFAEAAKKFPDLIVADPSQPYGHIIKDKEVFEMMTSLKQQALVLPIAELAELALFKLKKLGKSRPANTVVVPRQNDNAAPSKVKPKPAGAGMTLELEIQK